ncbi:hypothetical protein H5P28_17295 [Ruficoccus amylovorans]|uniref:PEP-CTERM sorting domain-containing protein n=1 Tax=Ruficoccus amylovorans TaxID=1804625 RepID=A0A842HH21_9BACT|nr:PEP-CTERM sorting domain-containing protein [Ruficoccus amylovorans]MBC2596025.1 hypothetical protein [Ruficoccus amylovorans]
MHLPPRRILCLYLALALCTGAQAAITINFVLSGSSTDFTAVFTVDSAAVSPSDHSSILSISVEGAGSFEPVQYYAGTSGSIGYYNASFTSGFYFDSLDFYESIQSGNTWEEMDGQSYAINNGGSTTMYAEGGSAISATGGSIAINIVPEPATYAVGFGLAALALLWLRKRRHT